MRGIVDNMSVNLLRSFSFLTVIGNLLCVETLDYNRELRTTFQDTIKTSYNTSTLVLIKITFLFFPRARIQPETPQQKQT